MRHLRALGAILAAAALAVSAIGFTAAAPVLAAGNCRSATPYNDWVGEETSSPTMSRTAIQALLYKDTGGGTTWRIPNWTVCNSGTPWQSDQHCIAAQQTMYNYTDAD
jgi:hypothetical protein